MNFNSLEELLASLPENYGHEIHKTAEKYSKTISSGVDLDYDNDDWDDYDLNSIIDNNSEKSKIIIANVTGEAKVNLSSFMYRMGEATGAAYKNNCNYFIIQNIGEIDYKVYDEAVETLESRGLSVNVINPGSKVQDAVVTWSVN